ncbi:MAG: dihydroorotase [Clostridia bacterium]|nr:dihydroorotase [Clostridia bacterium]
MLLKNATVYTNKQFVAADLLVQDGVIAAISPNMETSAYPKAEVFDLNKCLVLPGLVDVHVHFREPGFLYKETMETGSLAAARGGVTHVCTMPNLKPVPDSREHLDLQLEAIRKDAKVHVYPYGSITVNEAGEEMADLAAMAPDVIGFSDDGKGVQSEEMMRAAMQECVRLNKMLVAHCEVNELLRGGYIHDGEYAKAHGHKGICSESEWKQVERDLRLSEETGCPYHVCHVSAKETVALIREAKARGVNVTCETGPHYLVMNDTMIGEDGRFKMNPPIRSEEDRKALLEGLLDGTVDMLITDHAPHSAEEKGKGLAGSLMGVVGLETSFAVMYTKLVKTGAMTLEKLLDVMHDAPAKRFGIGTDLAVGAPADLTVFDTETAYVVDPADFVSKGKSSPFTGETLYGVCKLTLVNGEPVWNAL